MALPEVLEYNEAIQSPAICFADPELKQGQAATDRVGWPRPSCGNFAAVYKLTCPNKVWAVKCFHREVKGLQARYRGISAHLQQAKHQAGLPFMVDFEYQDKGIHVGKQWYPILKMRWVEGDALNVFVGKYLDQPDTLKALAGLWVKLAHELRDADMAHGDLQHGNVLLVQTKAGSVRPTLIDYDGMYVPALAQSKSGEAGHPNFQHPQRQRDPYHPEMDRFAHLVIYTAMYCLAAGGRRLWDTYNNDENLLFREGDFQEPSRSPLFQELWQRRDPAARNLVGHLLLATQGAQAQVPLLDDLLKSGQVPALSAAQEQQLQALLSAGKAQVRAVPRITAAPPIRIAPVPAARSQAPATTPRTQRTPPSTSPVAIASPRAPAASTKPLRKSSARAKLKSAKKNLQLALGLGFAGASLVLLAVAGFFVTSDPGAKPAKPKAPPAPTIPVQSQASSPKREDPAAPKGPEKASEPPYALPDAGTVEQIIVSPDGKKVLALTSRSLHAWTVPEGRRIWSWPTGFGGGGFAMSPSGKKVLVGSTADLALLDLETGKALRRTTVKSQYGVICAVSFYQEPGRPPLAEPETVAYADSSGPMGVSDWKNEPRTKDFLWARFGLSGRDIIGFGKVVFTPDGHRVFGTFRHGALFVDDLVTGDTDRLYEAKNRPFAQALGIAISPSGRWGLSSDARFGTLDVWDLQTRQQVKRLSGCSVPSRAVAFSPSEQRAISAAPDGTVRLWDLSAGKEIKQFPVSDVTTIAFFPNGRHVMYGAKSGPLQWLELPPEP